MNLSMEHFYISEFLRITNYEYKIKLIMDKLIIVNNLSQEELILYY
jgi:hypothetical protein